MDIIIYDDQELIKLKIEVKSLEIDFNLKNDELVEIVKIINNFFHFAVRVQRYPKVLVEGKRHRIGANNNIVIVNFFAVTAGLAGGNYHNLVATRSHTASKVTAESGNAIDSRIMKVRRNQDFHIL